MNEWLIQTDGLTREYGSHVSVRKLDMHVRAGSIYGFLGPNGAGKTTTIRMLLGLIRPTAGRVRLFGHDLSTRRTDILRRIGSLVESPSYYGHLTGFENLSVIAKLLRVDRKRIREVLDIVRLTQAADKTAKTYSLGMKQRLGIAAALLGSPELLILDEPTNGLDPAGIQEMRELIVSMPQEYGVTVVISSHLLGEIEQMATDVGIISQGTLVFEDAIDVLRQRSKPKLAFEVDRPLEAAQWLKRHGIAAEWEEQALVVPAVDDAEAAEMNRRLVTEGFAVSRIREMKPSLEQMFLDLVGKGNSL